MAMILGGTLSLASSSCSAADQVSRAWQVMAEQTEEMARTRISRENVDVKVGGADVRVTLKNTGQTPLADFSRWDVIVQYYGKKQQGNSPYFIKRLAFTEGTPENDQWKVQQIFEDEQTSKPEVFEPGILNPGEEVKIHMNLNPTLGVKTTNWVIIATSKGLPVPVTFTGPAQN